MKIEISEISPKNWKWRVQRGGNVTCWGYGYDTKGGAIRAATNECLAMAKLALGRPLTSAEKTEARSRVKTATEVVS